VTRNAVLTSPESGAKVSLRSPLMLPRVALIDPELTRDLPPSVTAATGLDALAQLIEPYLSVRSSPVIDPLCLDGMARIARSLPAAVRDGSDMRAREEMSFSSMLGGMALANAALGAVHGFAGPIGGRFPAPHGAVCAALLPHVVRANLAALTERDPENPILARFEEVARALTGRTDARASDAVDWLDSVREELDIPRLGVYGMAESDVPILVAQARRASSMRGNPIELTDGELTAILRAAI
jgi:alcohol dehydrogenase class IV